MTIPAVPADAVLGGDDPAGDYNDLKDVVDAIRTNIGPGIDASLTTISETSVATALETHETHANAASGHEALASTAPAALAAAAAVGDGTTAARNNHVHPTTGLMTTDTAQTVTSGVKTFRPGQLLMSNSDGSQTAEPYSDINAPQSFEMTQQGSAPANPAAGEAVLWTPDGQSLKMKNPAGTEVTIGPSGAGADSLALATEYTNTTPTTPSTGITLFARKKARNLPAIIGPTGLDTALQPAIFTNRIATWNAANNSATPTLNGLVVTNISAPTAVAVATTNFYTSMVRAKFASNSGSGSGAGTRSTSAQWHLSSTANKGGMFMVVRFGLGIITATNRGFIGFSTTTAALAPATDPTALLNLFGFGWNSAHTTMRFLHNDGSGTATSVDLGANFPVQTAATNFYEVRIFAPSGGGQTVHWAATRLNDGAFASGSTTTDLPAVDTLLSMHLHHSNGTTGVAVNIEVQSIYIETDN